MLQHRFYYRKSGVLETRLFQPITKTFKYLREHINELLAVEILTAWFCVLSTALPTVDTYNGFIFLASEDYLLSVLLCSLHD